MLRFCGWSKSSSVLSDHIRKTASEEFLQTPRLFTRRNGFSSKWLSDPAPLLQCVGASKRSRNVKWGLPLPVCGLGLPTRSSRKRNQGHVCCCHPADDLHVVRISESSG